MKKVLTLLAGVSLLLSMSICTNALAQDRAGTFSISPLAGFALFEGDQFLKTSPVYGGAFGYNFDEHFGVELGGSFIDSGTRRGNSVDVHTYFYHMDALYHMKPWGGKFQPYLAAGVGGMTFDYEGDVRGKDPVTAFAVNYGGGVEYFIADNFALRGDVRHVITTNGGFNDLLCTAGVTVYFGGKKMAKAEAAPPPPAPRCGLKSLHRPRPRRHPR